MERTKKQHIAIILFLTQYLFTSNMPVKLYIGLYYHDNDICDHRELNVQEIIVQIDLRINIQFYRSNSEWIGGLSKMSN